MVEQTPCDANRPSDELSRFTQELRNVQGELQCYRQRLKALQGRNRETKSQTSMDLVGSPNSGSGGACAPLFAPEAWPISLSPFRIGLISWGRPFATSLSRSTFGAAAIHAKTGFYLRWFSVEESRASRKERRRGPCSATTSFGLCCCAEPGCITSSSR